MIRDFSELTDDVIQKLISCPKIIISKDPKKEMREENNNYRTDLELVNEKDKLKFRLFLRKHKEFPGNFSIGLLFKSDIGEIKLIRFNGAHNTEKDDVSNHHYNFHIHKYERDFKEKGIIQLNRPEITSEYNNYDDALKFAFHECGVENYLDYYPDLEQQDLFQGMEI